MKLFGVNDNQIKVIDFDITMNIFILKAYPTIPCKNVDSKHGNIISLEVESRTAIAPQYLTPESVRDTIYMCEIT